MSEQIKGIVEQVNDRGAKKGRYGIQHQISIKVGGDWYGGFTKKSAEDMGLEEGKLVTFTATQSGDYLNFDAKTLKISSSPDSQGSSKAKASSGGSVGGSSSQAGIKVGHAINNAVQLAIAEGKAGDLKHIHKRAVGILALSVKLEAQFGGVVDKADEIYAKLTEEDSTQDEQPAEPKAETKGKTKPKAPAKKAAPPPPPPEDEDEDEGEQEDEGPTFDDDIPF